MTADTRELLPVAVLAGGLGTRLHPITATRPKALIDVGGRPFILRQLEYLRDQGVGQVVLCTGYLGEQIEAAVGDGHAFGIEVRYSPDGPTLLGTGGALRRALPMLGSSFFVLYGDSFLPCDFSEVQEAFLHSGKPALMTVLHNKQRWDRSNVIFRDGKIVVYDKRSVLTEMEHIDYGLGIVSAELLEPYPAEARFDLADIYHELSVSGRLAGCEVSERFYEIGTPKGLEETSAYFAQRDSLSRRSTIRWGDKS
jgi:N-acetyl-alpha-D-muramate 1-phosphate uridylyltransferase